jgi:hypothetical protein
LESTIIWSHTEEKNLKVNSAPHYAIAGGGLRRNILILSVILFLAASVLAATLLLTRFGLPQAPTPTPSPAISDGNGNTIEEKRALAAAENFNVTEAFNQAPFEGGYTPNFIDSKVINYYNNSYECAKEITHFFYDANVYTWNQTHAIYDKTGSSINVSSPNGSILFPSQGGWGVQIRYAYLNNSRYQEINADEIDFNFSNSYVVEMTLGYSQFPGPTAGYMVDVYQIVVVNEDFKPILLCVQSQERFS